MKTICAFTDAATGDGFRLDADERGRIALTLELAEAPPRTLVIVDRNAARGLGRALLDASRDGIQDLPRIVELEPGGRGPR